VDNTFWIVICEGHSNIKFEGGIQPITALHFKIESTAREFYSVVNSIHTVAILIQVVDGVANVVK